MSVSVMKMKNISVLFIVLLVLQACSGNNAGQQDQEQKAGIQNETEMSDFYNFKMKSLDGEEIDFSKFKGKKVLLVNVASECGFTPQYAELQELHETHGDKVAVLGFPANNFGGQESGTNEEIAEFCQKNFGVDFQMFSKISVKGDDQHPLYSWLREETGQEPGWNFSKYLLDENGTVLAFYPSDVKPMGPEILGQVKK